MKRLFVMILLVTVIFTPNITSPVSANPISMSSAISGGFLCFSSNISMPKASVNITLTCRDIIPSDSYWSTFFYEMDMQSSFVVYCEENQNTTIAFAYPDSWGDYYYSVTYDELQFEVFVNDTEVTTQIAILDQANLDWSILSLYEQDYWSNWGFLFENQFVLFNVTLYANQEITMRVNTNAIMSSDSDVFDFDYCVGTAKAWRGETLEEVRIRLLNTTQYIEDSFQPNASLTVIEEEDNAAGIWNLNFTSFEENTVGVSIRQNEYPMMTISATTTTSNQTQMTDDPTILTQTMFLFAGAGVVAILTIVIIYKKKV